MKSISHFIPEPAKAVLSDEVRAKKTIHQQESKLAKFRNVAKYLMMSFAADSFIAESNTDIANYK